MANKSRALRLAGLLLCVWAAAGPAAGAGTPFIVDSWSADTEEGLPDGEIISVVQTHDGYLWLGTMHGLVRFDGTHFTPFDEMNTPGLGSDRIVHLFEDSRTNLWVGTDTGEILMVKQGKIQSVDVGGASHESRLMSAGEDLTGAVWLFLADGRLVKYQNGKTELLNLNFPPPPITRLVAVDKSGELWVAFEHGMFWLHPENFHPPAVAIDNSLGARWQLDYILPGRSGGMWCLMDGHVLKLGGAQAQTDFGTYPWGNATVKAACEDKDGNLIVGTLGAGIYWYDGDRAYEHISKPQGLSSDFVLSLCLDSEGNLWAGTDGDGLNRIKRKSFSAPAEVHPWAAQSICPDGRGGLWMAFNAAGLSYWTTNSMQDFAIGRFSNAWCVLADREGRVWAGTLGEGLFQLQDDRFAPVPEADILGPRIFALFEDHAGQVWVGTQNGLGCWNNGSWKLFTTGDGLSENSVRTITEDAAGKLWVGTESVGLDCLSDGKFSNYRQAENGLPGDDISCLYAGSNGDLWVGTSGHGLARLAKGKWARFSTRDGLASDSISYITADNEGNLWVGSNAGLMRIGKHSLEDFATGTTNMISCRTYGREDGLPSRECSAGSQPAAGRTADGRLWFPTIKGLVSVDPAQLRANPRPPLVMIESILVNGRELKTNRLDSAWPPAITIPPGGGELEVGYTALNFSAPERVRFKYVLEPEEREAGWTDAKADRVARYPELSPGHYRFRVEAGNEDNVWSGQDAATLAVTVEPQFWQTGWFQVVAALCLLALVAAAARYFSTQKLQRQLQTFQQREALERERARIARDLHDQLGANLTQVALLGEMAEADKEAPAEVESHAQQIAQTARETTRSLDEIVWAVNPANDTLDGLVNYAGKYAQEYLALAGLRCRADLPAQLPAIPIPPEVRHNVFLAFKEAVHNVVKHARAGEARIRLRLEPGRFILEVEDDGAGIPNLEAKQDRNGLRNMRKRMNDVRGEFFIGPAPERGTLVRLTVPIISEALNC